MCHNLTIDDDLIVYGCRLLIPRQMGREMLNQLHEAHQGMVRTKQRARLTIYWPGLDNDIDNMVSQCTQCQTHLPSHSKEPLISKPRPAQPFQEIAADFWYHAGRNYLVFVDCFTDWPTVVPMSKCATSTDLNTAARELFSRTAMPDVFWSDGGPQFTSHQFQNFSTHWGFRHLVSSPYYPQRNGKAEATVKAMKKSFGEHGMGDFWMRTNCASPVTVSQHSISKRWVITSSEAFWASHAGYTTSPFQVIFP